MSRLHKPKAGFWIRLCVTILYPFDGIFFRIRWHHLQRMPAPGPSGGVIIVMNHVSHIDTVLMARMVWQSGRVPRFLIKSGVFEKPGLGQIMRGAKQIPVYRGTDDAAKSLREAVIALNQGEAIVIYAEGTITKDPDQWPMQAKTGSARLVLLAPHIPVVPIGQWGAQKTKNRLTWFTRRLAQASVGEPLDLSAHAGEEPTTENLRAITDQIMTAVTEQVAQLRGQPAPAGFFKPIGKTRADGIRD
jgi:1-acyl-sn-glycerol-3-phosphate acyltransferase